MDTATSPIARAGASLLPIGDLLAYHATRDPARPAITYDDVTTSFSELEARANRKARQLADLGVGENDVVTLALPNGLEFYESAFAVWKLGATPNIVSSRLPVLELQAIVELASPRLVIGEEQARIPGWNFLAAGTPPDQHLSDAPLGSRRAGRWKIHTSGGSTGRPKLIVAKQAAEYDPDKVPVGQQAGDTMLNPGPLYHNAPFVSAFQTLYAGNHVVEMGKFDPVRALELIERHNVNWVTFVPTMMNRISRLPVEERERFDVSSLRRVIHLAAACPIWLKQSWIDWLGPDRILEVYGGSELFGGTMITGREWLSHKGSVGRVQPGFRMRILDEQGNDCPPGDVGEIYFLPDRGANSTYEYIGAEAKSVGGWQTYGDLGHVDPEGYLYIADRRTDMIVSGGANIFPAEVEAAIDQFPAVHSSVVIGLPDTDLGQRAHAIVQLAAEDAAVIDADRLREFLATRLVRYKIPRSFEFTDKVLRDDAGKVRRSKLRDERLSGSA